MVCLEMVLPRTPSLRNRVIVTQQLCLSLGKNVWLSLYPLIDLIRSLLFPKCLFSWYIFFYNYKFWANQVSPCVKLCQARDRRLFRANLFLMRTRHASQIPFFFVRILVWFHPLLSFLLEPFNSLDIDLIYN